MAQNTTPIEQVWSAKGNLPNNAIVATADGKYPALDGSLITGISAGDMSASVYDPTAIEGDAFARANHTGTQTAATISDFDAEVTNNATVAANSAKVTNATHTGDVTGDTVLTIANDAVDIPMLSATGTADGTTFLRGDNVWATPAGGGGGDVATDAIWDAKGDLAGGTGADAAARLPIGTDGQVLTADSLEVTGMKWAAAGGGGGIVGNEVDSRFRSVPTVVEQFRDSIVQATVGSGTYSNTSTRVVISTNADATDSTSYYRSNIASNTDTRYRNTDAFGRNRTRTPHLLEATLIMQADGTAEARLTFLSISAYNGLTPIAGINDGVAGVLKNASGLFGIYWNGSVEATVALSDDLEERKFLSIVSEGDGSIEWFINSVSVGSATGAILPVNTLSHHKQYTVGVTDGGGGSTDKAVVLVNDLSITKFYKKMEIKKHILEFILGESIYGTQDGLPILSSGQALTDFQMRSIQPMLENGEPEIIDVAAVKAEASRRILALLPAHKQANTLARSSELLEILASGGTLTAEEEADRLAAKAAWAEVSAIRAASNTIESQELPTDYLALIEAFDAILV